MVHYYYINSLSANPTEWSDTQICLSVFEHFVGLALKGLRIPNYGGLPKLNKGRLNY